MIIVKLNGGLGNQLFQYATARSLAHRHNTELKLDISALGNGRDYGLDKFNIIEHVATDDECCQLTTPNYSSAAKAIHSIFHKKAKRAKSHIRVKDPHFQSKYLKLPDNVILEGYWQSERYFLDIADTIRREFSLKTVPSGKNSDTATAISSCNAVSLHIRRGDYLSDPKANQTHGTIGLDYYRQCTDLVSKAVADVHFFIFSDEPKWCEEHLELSHPVTYVNHNPPEAPHEDLRLMSLCKHNIIANSTFSWWGAWLNANPNKIVYAPLKWYATDRRRTDGLVPDEWLRV